MIRVERFLNRPILTSDMDDAIGRNINGPSLIKVPDWIKRPLGRYYLYFAHHQGKFIRLAYADHVEGPWTVYHPGTLQLEQALCRKHIASPDVQIDQANRRLVMFYHGFPQRDHDAGQRTMAAVSEDGIRFTAFPDDYGPAYWRSFFWQGFHYGLTMSGTLYRRFGELLGSYEEGPDLFREMNLDQRHFAIKLSGDRLFLFYSIRGDSPEHIVVSRMKLDGDWRQWKVDSYESVLFPELDYEGADLPIEASQRGAIHTRVRQLRDPGIYEENGETYLLYSIAGESGLAMVKITIPE